MFQEPLDLTSTMGEGFWPGYDCASRVTLPASCSFSFVSSKGQPSAVDAAPADAVLSMFLPDRQTSAAVNDGMGCGPRHAAAKDIWEDVSEGRMSGRRFHKLLGLPTDTSHGHRLVVILLVIFQPKTGVEGDGMVCMLLLLLLLAVETVVVVMVMMVIHDGGNLVDGKSL